MSPNRAMVLGKDGERCVGGGVGQVPGQLGELALQSGNVRGGA